MSGKKSDIEQKITGESAALLLKKLRVSAMFHSLLVFLGAFITQFAASMLCMIAAGCYVLFVQGQDRAALQKLLLQSAGDLSMVISLIYAVAAIVWCGILYRRWEWRERPFNYKKAFERGRIFFIIILGFGACIVLTVAVGIVAQIFPAAFENYQKLMDSLSVERSMLAVPYVALLGPVAEELIFRGVISDRLKPAFPFWLVNAIQAALFGIFHMNVIQGAYAFVLGLLLGLVVKVTGTLFSSMILHIVFNTTSLLLSAFVTHAGKLYDILSGVILFVALLCFLAGYLYFTHEYKRNEKSAIGRDSGEEKGNMIK